MCRQAAHAGAGKQLLLLDEVDAALDELNQARVAALLQQLAGGSSAAACQILAVTHNAAFQTCGHLVQVAPWLVQVIQVTPIGDGVVCLLPVSALPMSGKITLRLQFPHFLKNRRCGVLPSELPAMGKAPSQLRTCMRSASSSFALDKQFMREQVYKDATGTHVKSTADAASEPTARSKRAKPARL